MNPLEPVTTTLAAAASRMSCTLGSGGKKLFRTPKIPCNFAGIRSEEAEQMPEKEQHRRERDNSV